MEVLERLYQTVAEEVMNTFLISLHRTSDYLYGTTVTVETKVQEIKYHLDMSPICAFSRSSPAKPKWSEIQKIKSITVYEKMGGTERTQKIAFLIEEKEYNKLTASSLKEILRGASELTPLFSKVTAEKWGEGIERIIINHEKHMKTIKAKVSTATIKKPILKEAKMEAVKLKKIGASLSKGKIATKGNSMCK